MARIRDSIEVSVPADTAYRYWLRFEDYPRFMAGVQEVKRLNDNRLHWRASVNGRMREWDAEVVENIPAHRLAWRSENGLNDAIIVLNPTGWGTTRINIEMEQEPIEAVGDTNHYLQAASHRVHADLENFRERILNETRGHET